MNKMNFRFFALLCLLFITACVTTPKPYGGRQQSGFWEAKAQAKDLTTDKSYNISLDITAMTPSNLRMDVTGTLGINLATLVMHDNEIRFLLHRQKKYYQGQLSDRALAPLFKINLNPKLFMNVSMDMPIEANGWNCQSDAKGMVESCLRSSDGLKILWSDRDGNKKRVLIADKNFELNILFKSYTPMDPTKVQGDKDPFQIESPKDFTRYKIP